MQSAPTRQSALYWLKPSGVPLPDSSVDYDDRVTLAGMYGRMPTVILDLADLAFVVFTPRVEGGAAPVTVFPGDMLTQLRRLGLASGGDMVTNANRWASTVGKDWQGAFRAKAGMPNGSVDRIANDLAGTTGKGLLAALRRITNL